MVETVRPQEAI